MLAPLETTDPRKESEGGEGEGGEGEGGEGEGGKQIYSTSRTIDSGQIGYLPQEKPKKTIAN